MAGDARRLPTGAAAALAAALGLGWASPATAQIATDGSAGPVRTLGGPGFQIPESLGRRAGGNLLHSFRTFGLRQGESATFDGGAGIRAVIARVTGGTASRIDGRIGFADGLAGADFWLVNPSGVTFGPDASLDIPGSVHVATADRILFADGSALPATATDAGSFSTAPPQAFGFLAAAPAALRLEGSRLRLASDSRLVLAGGAVALADAGLESPGGGMVLAGAAAGSVVPADGPATAPAGAVALQRSRLSVSGGAGGRLVLDAAAIELRDSALVAAGDPAGAIVIRGGQVDIAGGVPGADGLAGDAGLFRLAVVGGRVEIEGGAMRMRDGATIRVAGGGSLTLDVDTLVLDGGVRAGAAAEALRLPTSPFPGVTIPPIPGAPSLPAPGVGIPLVAFPDTGFPILQLPADETAPFDFIGATVPTFSFPGGTLPPFAFPGGFIPPFVFPGLTIPPSGGAGGELPPELAGIPMAPPEFPGGAIPSFDLTVEGLPVAMIAFPGLTIPPFSFEGGTVPAFSFAGGYVPPFTFPGLAVPPFSLPGMPQQPGPGPGPGAPMPPVATPGPPAPPAGGPGTPAPMPPAGPATPFPPVVSPGPPPPGPAVPGGAGPGTPTLPGSGPQGPAPPAAGGSGAGPFAPGSIQALSGGADPGAAPGRLVVRAGELIVRNGAGIVSLAAGAAPGSDIEITAGTLRLLDGGVLGSATLGTGRPGRLDIAADNFAIAGRNELGVVSGILAAPALTPNAAASGEVRIDMRTMEIGDGGVVNANTRVPLPAGSIIIRGGSLTVRGGGGITTQSVGGLGGPAGRIGIEVESLALAPGALIASTTDAAGAGGSIAIVAGRAVTLAPGAAITASSIGSGEAGSIAIDAGLELRLDGARITTETTQANGGNITLQATELLLLRGGAEITTSVAAAEGDGGNIDIDPRFVVLDGGVIRANAFGGDGGDISIRADNFLLSPDSSIEASSRLGLDGTIRIDAPDVDAAAGMAVLPAGFADASDSLASACAARRGEVGASFVGVGRGRLPPAPGAAAGTRYAPEARAAAAAPGPAQVALAGSTAGCGP